MPKTNTDVLSLLSGLPNTGKSSIYYEIIRLIENGQHDFTLKGYTFLQREKRNLNQQYSELAPVLAKLLNDKHLHYLPDLVAVYEVDNTIIAISTGGDSSSLVKRSLDKINNILDDNNISLNYLFLSSHLLTRQISVRHIIDGVNLSEVDTMDRIYAVNSKEQIYFQTAKQNESFNIKKLNEQIASDLLDYVGLGSANRSIIPWRMQL
ncbi:hypothetical protein [Leuconostoc mesenteroides]|uniref:hypothetical protein n=1 Tax=Leuconostoc mesenteroides TaxID=1245 RepID=UPI001CBBFDD6|nr:hypothetical protein [Leuconostoc mesenteroides]MBZ1509336.1 hypothetical protein [Leuconostoc mesenteroides]MBZ1533983.1 hypothetical protein [Leuconostoc mesenteroides]